MKTTLINSMVSFTLGTGATLVALASWLGTTDLQEIKDSVSSYVSESEEHASALVEEYNVMVDQANAEIGDYKAALDKANSNISQLIEKYEQDQAQAGEDISDLQAELEAMQARLDQQYESDMNEIIEKANVEINKANEEVAQAKMDVQGILGESQMGAIAGGEKSELSTGGDKTVTDISSVTGGQVQEPQPDYSPAPTPTPEQQQLAVVSVESLGNQSVSYQGSVKTLAVHKITFTDGKEFQVILLENGKGVQAVTENGFKYVYISETSEFKNEYSSIANEYLANQQ